MIDGNLPFISLTEIMILPDRAGHRQSLPVQVSHPSEGNSFPTKRDRDKERYNAVSSRNDSLLASPLLARRKDNKP